MNTETKRHIDAARQVLVGVVPNPTSQIDQITNALIYKFMDDMDQTAIKAGGKPSFFVGDLEKYAWTRLMDSRIGNQERMNIYTDALIKFSQSKQLPELFRSIFRSAFLPYRSPEVLGLFLKEISYFDYSHSEELGEGYEYLLSIMSSQGDAGQFRTPRHIIDFMVEVVDPKKDDKILDPACGTAGFLISAYKHILKQHDGVNSGGSKNNEKSLTPDERRNLINNFEGYDIDPGMVRIAQVNMYLHQFKNPKIFQYDTLSMEDRWNDKFDIILANPPFMSPKGGVQTHNKFSIQSNRSEVLFVDYFINHLRPKGRACIIVPEGIIFQSGTAHKQLRKNMLDDGLYAVVSLPSGVFQPYAGVKTSILLFDNELAKKTKEILFVKIENDGFDLGAQRRPSQKNDLPFALQTIKEYRDFILTGNAHNNLFLERIKEVGKIGETLSLTHDKFSITSKNSIKENIDYNLSADRYKIATEVPSRFEMVELGEILELSGKKRVGKNQYPIMSITMRQGLIDQADKFKKRIASENIENYKIVNFRELVVGFPIDEGVLGFQSKYAFAAVSPAYEIWKIKDSFTANIDYLETVFRSDFARDVYKSNMQGAVSRRRSIPKDVFLKIKIPFPPLEIQEQIVAELESYQNIINGAKQIVQNWKPKLAVDPEWEKIKLGDICNPEYGFTDTAKEDGETRFIRITDISSSGELISENKKYIELTGDAKKYLLVRGDLLVARTGATYGKTLLFNNNFPSVFASFLIRLRFPKEKMLPEFYWAFSQTEQYWKQANQLMTGGGQPQFNGGAIKQIEIPLPSIEVQKQIVEKIEAERTLVKSAKKLIEIYELKTKETIAKLWGE